MCQERQKHCNVLVQILINNIILLKKQIFGTVPNHCTFQIFESLSMANVEKTIVKDSKLVTGP